MRNLLTVGLLVLGGMTSAAFADGTVTAAAPADTNAAQCMPEEVEGAMTMACFNLTDAQVQSLGVATEDANVEDGPQHCENFCDGWDHHGHCHHWHHHCW